MRIGGPTFALGTMPTRHVLGAFLVMVACSSSGHDDSVGAVATGAAMGMGAAGPASSGGAAGAGTGGLAGGSASGAPGSAGSGGGSGATTGGAATSGGSPSGGGASGGPSGGGESAGAPSSGGVSAGAPSGGGAPGGGVPAVDPDAYANYYVSPSGNDANPGTLDAPFLTLEKARDVVRTVNADMTGDVYVYLRSGTYRLTQPIAFGPEDSGANDHTVHYLAVPGETPVLNGATSVTGWAPYDDHLYQATLNRSGKLRNLYVDDARAFMASKTATSKGGEGTYSVTAGQADWAWTSGSGSDGVKYGLTDIPDIQNNKDDLEIVNATTWNENIVCVRDVVTTSDNNRALLLQQPYGAIAQLPGWNAGFSVNGTHTILNALEFLDSPGEFYFDKSTSTLYYYPRAGEDMATATVEAPVAERLIDIAGTSTTKRVRNVAFEGITFANTDYNLYAVDGSRGKASVQGATVFIAYGNGDWHSSTYRIIDTFPGVINVANADSLSFVRNVVKHSGAEGIVLNNDVVDTALTGNYIADTAGSGITVGHPQHVYIGDGGTDEKYAPGTEGVCANISITNNLIYNTSSVPGFGGHSGITAFFVEALSITHNQIQSTAYNGINLGWGWRNFTDSTTCKDNIVSQNRFIDTLNRLHDSGAVYTIGQMPGTEINENYVRGIPPATSGPTYGLHNDEGTAYIVENDNVLDIDPGVKYTINCEDFGDKHDLTILRTYATVNKMGANPPNSMIDPPVAVPDNVWPLEQYDFVLSSGIQDEYRDIIPSEVLSVENHVFPASCSVSTGTPSIGIRESGSGSDTVWFAPADTKTFVEGPGMTSAAGNAGSIAAPSTPGGYKLHVLDADGTKLGESTATLRVE